MSYKFYFLCSCLSIFGFLKLYYTKYLAKICKSKVCLVGKTVLITGGNSGIGYASALNLAQRGARVILACRNEQRGTKAVENIIKLTENNNVVLKILDLASFNSIKRFAKDISENEKRLDILINNAGILGGEGVTEDALQVEWQINYFGPVLLTLLLLDLLKKSPPSRIINVSSECANYAKLSLETFNIYTNHFETYNNTKLCNILFTQELAKKLKHTNISVFSLHPGAVETEILSYSIFSYYMRPIMKVLLQIFYISLDEGAQTTVYCACEQNIEHLTGRHFKYCNVAEPYKAAQDSQLARKIWDETLRIIQYDNTE